MLEITIDVAQRDYLPHLSVVKVQGNTRIMMSCTAIRPLVFSNGHTLAPYETLDCAYIDGVHVLVPPIVFLVAVVSWPASRWAEWRGRILISLPMLLCVVALTTTDLFIGLERMARIPGRVNGIGDQMAVLMQPFIFMELGGRWLLPLLAAAACIRLATPKAAS